MRMKFDLVSRNKSSAYHPINEFLKSKNIRMIWDSHHKNDIFSFIFSSYISNFSYSHIRILDRLFEMYRYAKKEEKKNEEKKQNPPFRTYRTNVVNDDIDVIERLVGNNRKRKRTHIERGPIARTTENPMNTVI